MRYDWCNNNAMHDDVGVSKLSSESLLPVVHRMGTNTAADCEQTGTSQLSGAELMNEIN